MACVVSLLKQTGSRRIEAAPGGAGSVLLTVAACVLRAHKGLAQTAADAIEGISVLVVPTTPCLRKSCVKKAMIM